MKKYIYYLLLVIGIITTLIILIYIIKKNKKNLFSNMEKDKKDKLILMGGLDNRPGDKNLTEQLGLVKKGLRDNVEIEGYRYSDLSGVIASIEKNPKTSVMLFSAGCRYAEDIAKKLKEKNQDLSRLFIVEPYHSGGSTTNSVKNAIKLGVPQKNVFTGSSSATGLGIVDNTSRTPKCSPNHWCALSEIAKIV